MSTAGVVLSTIVCPVGFSAPLFLSASITWILMPG